MKYAATAKPVGGDGDPAGADRVARIDTCSCPSVNATNNLHNAQGVLKCGDDAAAGSGSGSGGKSSCKGEGSTCSSSTECCSGHCEVSNPKSSAYHKCN